MVNAVVTKAFCHLLSGLVLAACLLAAAPARAEFVIGTAILEFTSDGPRQQDVELSGHGTEGSDYIVTEISEMHHPGAPDETRDVLAEPEQGRLLVTPDKTILPAGSRQLLRFVLLQDLDATEHVYRVAIKPVVKGVAGKDKVGLKILIGYEVLVILRPAAIASAYTARREGKSLALDNTGNSDILFQNGQQTLCRHDAGRAMPACAGRAALSRPAADDYPAAERPGDLFGLGRQGYR